MKKLIVFAMFYAVANVAFADRLAFRKAELKTAGGDKVRRDFSKASFSELPWNDSGLRDLTREFLSAYVRLYIEFPKALSPYSDLYPNVDSHTLVKFLCSENLEPLCKNNVKFLTREIENILDLSASAAPHLQGSWEKLHENVELLKTRFERFDHEIRWGYGQLSLNAKSGLTSISQLAQELDLLWVSAEDSREQYLRQYAEVVQGYPGRLLFTKTFLGLIEGLHFKVEKVDILNAVAEVTKTLTSEYLVDLFSILAAFPTERRQSLVDHWNPEWQALRDRHRDFSKYRYWSRKTLEELPVWSSFSKSNKPVLTDETGFVALKEFSAQDANTFDFLLQGNYQRAIWQLRDLGKAELAERLENFVVTKFITAENLKSLRPLGMGGVSTTFLASFSNGVQGVYKPAGDFRHPIDKISGNYRKEVAAYVLDKAFDLRHVPITVFAKFGEYAEGSLQYYVKDTLRARDVKMYDMTKPGKFTAAVGRGKKDGDLLFFDWLISNFDRNQANYLFYADGRVAYIDHGFTFVKVVPNLYGWKKMQKMVPSERVYERALYFNSHPEELKKLMAPYIYSSQIWMMQTKLHHAVKLMEKHKEELGY